MYASALREMCIRDRLWRLESLSAEEVSGIPSVAVKCVEIGRNTSGEGDLLGRN